MSYVHLWYVHFSGLLILLVRIYLFLRDFSSLVVDLVFLELAMVLLSALLTMATFWRPLYYHLRENRSYYSLPAAWIAVILTINCFVHDQR